MLKVDEAIYTTSKTICGNIRHFDISERGLLAQNILAQTRNLLEYIAVKLYGKGLDLEPHDYENNVKAINYIRTNGKYRFLVRFHELLQKSVSHYTLDEGGSERLMLKYYEHLLKIKKFLKDEYGMQILENIEDFPLHTDPELTEYYLKIAECIEKRYTERFVTAGSFTDRYYIQKIKPFFVKEKIYYEVTLSIANDRINKTDRIIAFTDRDILSNYAVHLSVRDDAIEIMGKFMPIQIIDEWEVSIRPCEMVRFASILGQEIKMDRGLTEYKELMKLLKEERMNFLDIIDADTLHYDYIKERIISSVKSARFFGVLEKARNFIKSKSHGTNLLRYLLFTMNNRVMKLQYYRSQCGLLSGLYLRKGCNPFENMPFATSLCKHNPKLWDLLECLDSTGREHEFLARQIKNNAEMHGVIFTDISELERFQPLDERIDMFNRKLWEGHAGRQLQVYCNHVYIREYVENCVEIIRRLRDLSKVGITDYTVSVDYWLSTSAYSIDCIEKKEVIRKMFVESKVALVYGSAGTGKSTLINHLSHYFKDEKKIYLANTNPAVDNIRRKVDAANETNSHTIASFLSWWNQDTDCDVLIIDECSTVSNEDMCKILGTAKFDTLILVGDVYQIEAISFGNWFNIARFFIPQTSVCELTEPFRTKNVDLLTVWERVRNLDDAILEPLVKKQYSVDLDESIFDNARDDEIILCLNYDGLYGINNINRFLQSNNPNPPIQWGIYTYKVGDPILFNESDRFAPLIYNNMKGQILNIKKEERRIFFTVELDTVIHSNEAQKYGLEYVGVSEKGNSKIRFYVNKLGNLDDDDDVASDSIIPFQVAYAVSIHKAQGLEYSSVKIVITDEIEEMITHNIFYTAITRARKDLKIYWSAETEKKFLSNLKKRDYSKDGNLLRIMYNL